MKSEFQKDHSVIESSLIKEFCNANGLVRLNRVKNSLKYNQLSLEQIKLIYRKWVNQKEYFVLWEEHKSKGHAYLCAKRGNDVYNYKINQKFKDIEKLANFYGDTKLFDINEPAPKTNCVFVTFTYDRKISSLDESWNLISEQYNRAISAIKRKFGNCAIIRAYEAFKDGYPHIHAIIIFDNYFFDVFEHWSKQGLNSTYRIKQKSEFEKIWHSFIDVTAVHSIKGALGYITKYLKKSYNDSNGKYELTRSLLWLKHKQAFAISGKFSKQLEQIRLVTASLSNSNGFTQSTLDGSKIKKYKFIGIFTYQEITKNNHIINPYAWVLSLNTIPEHNVLNSEDKRIMNYLSAANTGVSLRQSRSVRIGVQVVPMGYSVGSIRQLISQNYPLCN